MSTPIGERINLLSFLVEQDAHLIHLGLDKGALGEVVVGDHRHPLLRPCFEGRPVHPNPIYEGEVSAQVGGSSANADGGKCQQLRCLAAAILTSS